MMRKVLGWTVFAVMFGGATPALADVALDRIKARGRLVVVVKNEGEQRQAAHKDPAHFAKRNFEIAIAREIAQEMLGSADALELKLLRKRDRLPAVASGEADLGLSMFAVTPASAALVDFSKPYTEHNLAAMTVGEAPATLDALNGRRIGLIARNDAGRLGPPAGLKVAEWRAFERFEAAAAALQAGEIDALLSERQNILAFIADGHAELHCSPTLERVPVAVALPKASPDLQAAVDGVIERLERDGKLARLAADSGLSAGD